MCDTNKVITETKLLRLISTSFNTKNTIQQHANNQRCRPKSTTSYTFIKANNTLDSVTGVTNTSIYNYGHGKFHLQVTLTQNNKQNIKI